MGLGPDSNATNSNDQSLVEVAVALPTGTNSIGQVTANAGTNLNTSALALDSTVAKDSSLSTINTSVNTLLKPANTLAAVTTLGSITSALPTGTNSIGQVTANAGTNLNTSALALETTLSGQSTLMGAVNETAPASDTASSGANGRLQRIAQRITSLIALIPTSLGQKTMANSFAVTIGSDQTGINSFLDGSGSGTIGALNGAVTITTNGMSMVTLTITGTWVATLTLQGDAGVASWPSILGILPYPSGALASAIGSNVTVMIPVGGLKQIRIIATAYTSGTATVTWNSGAGAQTVQVINNESSSLQAQVQGNSASSATDSGNPVKIGAIANTTLPTVTAGQRVNVQADLNGRVYVNSVPIDGIKATYSTSIVGLAQAALATDIFTITGSASKTIRVTRLEISATQTTAGNANIILLKRSTANSAGTSTAPAKVPHDSTNAAATATVLAYTANPTVGSLVGQVRANKIFISTATTLGEEITMDFGTRPSQAIVLRGTSEVLALNLNGVTLLGGSFDIDIEWTEE